MSNYPEILILGDGIAGRAAALAWTRAGGTATIIAPKADHPLQGGVQLAPNGWAALTTLGIDDAARTVSTPLSMMRLLSSDTGNTLAQVNLNTPSRRPYTGVDRQGLTDILGAACTATGQVTWHDGVVTTLTSTAENAAVTLADGTVKTAPFIIGADGVTGHARAFVTAGDSSAPHLPLTRQAYRAVAPLDALPEYFAAKATSVWLGDGGHMVFYPLTTGQLNIVAVTTAGSASMRQAMGIINAQSILAPLAPYIEKAQAVPLHRHLPLDVLRRGRVILCGDAAHPMPPHLAQGAGQSLVDAASLYQVLSAHGASPLDDAALNTALTTWTASRLKATRSIQQKAERAGRIFALDGPFAKIRNLGLATLGGAAMERALDKIWQS